MSVEYLFEISVLEGEGDPRIPGNSTSKYIAAHNLKDLLEQGKKEILYSFSRPKNIIIYILIGIQNFGLRGIFELVSPSNITIESDLVLKLLMQKDQVRFFLREIRNGVSPDDSSSSTRPPDGSRSNSITRPTASASSGDESNSIDPAATTFNTRHSNTSSEEVTF